MLFRSTISALLVDDPVPRISLEPLLIVIFPLILFVVEESVTDTTAYPVPVVAITIGTLITVAIAFEARPILELIPVVASVLPTMVKSELAPPLIGPLTPNTEPPEPQLRLTLSASVIPLVLLIYLF